MKKIFKLLFLLLIFGIGINIVRAESASCGSQVEGTDSRRAVGDVVNYQLGTMGAAGNSNIFDVSFYVLYDKDILELQKDSLKAIDGWKLEQTIEEENGYMLLHAYTEDKTKMYTSVPLTSFYKVISMNFKIKDTESTKASIIVKGASSSYKNYLGVNEIDTSTPYTRECGNSDLTTVLTVYKKDTNTGLSSLKVNKGELTPAFDSNVTDYTVDVENEETTIEIEAKCAGTKCQSSGAGTKELKVGENKFVIKVTSESGKVNEYKITVNRAAKEEIFLNKLEIKNGKLGSEFDSKKYNYTVNVGSDVDKLDFEYEVNDEETVDVRVVGNENFKEGNNTVIIELTNTKTEETIKYELVVIKEKAVVEEKKSSLGLIIALVVVSLIAIGAVVYIVISKKKNKTSEVISSSEVVETNEVKEENKEE